MSALRRASEAKALAASNGERQASVGLQLQVLHRDRPDHHWVEGIWRAGLSFVLILFLLWSFWFGSRRARCNPKRLSIGFLPSMLHGLAVLFQLCPPAAWNVFFNTSHLALWRLMPRISYLLYGKALLFLLGELQRELQQHGMAVGAWRDARSCFAQVCLDFAFLGLTWRRLRWLNRVQQSAIALVDISEARQRREFLFAWIPLGLYWLWILVRIRSVSVLVAKQPYSVAWFPNVCYNFAISITSMNFIASQCIDRLYEWLRPDEMLDSSWLFLNNLSGKMILEGTSQPIAGCLLNTIFALLTIYVFLPSKQHSDLSKRIIVDMQDLVEMRLWTHFMCIFGALKRGPNEASRRMSREEWLTSVLLEPRSDKETDIVSDLGNLLIVPEGDVIMEKRSDVAALVFQCQNYELGQNRAVVSFRGTQSARNMAEDCRICKAPLAVPGLAVSEGDSIGMGKNAYVHRGFQDSLLAMKPQILDRLGRLLEREKCPEVWLVGHSLGGALATLLAIDVRQYLVCFDRRWDSDASCKTTLNVFTAGSPRVGNAAFVQLFNSAVDTSVRVVNDYDPVPMMPPGMFGWRHVRGLALITNYGHLRKDPLFLEKSVRKHAFALSLLPCFCRNFSDFTVSHQIKMYIASLRTVFDMEQRQAPR